MELFIVLLRKYPSGYIKKEIRMQCDFKLGDGQYGFNISNVQNCSFQHWIPMSDFVEGVINLRGKVIPVLDLAKNLI